jgi:hypothetical protein
MRDKVRNVPSVEAYVKVGRDYLYNVSCRYCGNICGTHGVTKERVEEISKKYVECSKTKTFRGEMN